MKTLLQITLLLVSISFYSQQKFHFDRAVVVKSEIQNKDSLERFEYNYLINSENIDYIASIKFKKDSTLLYFSDIKGIQIIQANFKSLEFNASESYTIDCKLVSNFSNTYKFKADEYDFVQLQDTVYEGKSYYHLVIQSNKSLKYQKRKKIPSCHFIIEKNINEIPFVYAGGPLLINTWKKNNLSIKGRTLFTYFKSYNGKITRKDHYEYGEINRYLLIPEACDYVKNPINIKTLKSL